MEVTYELKGNGTGEVRLALGSVVPPAGALNVFSSGLESIPEEFHELVPLMRHYYETDCLFGTVIDILVRFSISNTIQNVTDDSKVQEFFDAIVETSNLKQACKWAVLEYHLLSNVWPLRSNTKRKVRSRNGAEVPLYEWTVLNPECVYVKGSLLFNRYSVVIRPNDELRELVSELERKELNKFLPSKMIRAIEGGNDILLDERDVYHIARDKQPFQRYAPVALKRLIKPLRIKEKYMEMDLATAEGLINQIIVFKLGNDEYPVLTDEPLKKFSNLLMNGNRAYQLVWNHTLEIEHIRPDPSALDPAKYGPINQELFYGFATPSALIGGDTKGYSKDWIAVKGLVERLRWARNDLEQWLEREFRIIAEENNLKSWPKPKLGDVNLEEERTFKEVLLKLYNHGILSGQTLLDETGYEFLTEVERLKIEKEIREKEGILIPSSPYQKSKNDPDAIGVPPVEGPGRPAGTPDSEERDRRTPNPRPSGSGSLAVAIAQRDEYLKDLVALYGGTRKALEEAVKQFEGERRLEVIAAVLLAFMEEMKKLGSDSITNAFVSRYAPSNHDETVFQQTLDDVIKWNDYYVEKFYNDLKGQVEFALDREDVDEILTFMEAVFDKEEYRLAHFAREGIVKGQFAGDLATHKIGGSTGGIWNCVFRNSCDECIARHGQEYSIDELMDIYPAHNRCQCYIDFI